MQLFSEYVPYVMKIDGLFTNDIDWLGNWYGIKNPIVNKRNPKKTNLNANTDFDPL